MIDVTIVFLLDHSIELAPQVLFNKELANSFFVLDYKTRESKNTSGNLFSNFKHGNY